MLFLVILLFTLISCVHAAEQQIDAPEKIWRKNFEQLREFKTTQFYEAFIRWQKLQHDPQITLVVKDDPTIIQQSGPTLFIHGWVAAKIHTQRHAYVQATTFLETSSPLIFQTHLIGSKKLFLIGCQFLNQALQGTKILLRFLPL